MTTLESDFLSPTLRKAESGSRELTVADNYSRESLAILSDIPITAYEMVSLMKHLKSVHGRPQRIQVDNRSEVISQVSDIVG
jgi:uncharacterized protein YjhX (UPF0386 family)